jgi:hypothetical protein
MWKKDPAAPEMKLQGKKQSRCEKITWPEKCAERHSFQYPLEGYKEP